MFRQDHSFIEPDHLGQQFPLLVLKVFIGITLSEEKGITVEEKSLSATTFGAARLEFLLSPVDQISKSKSLHQPEKVAPHAGDCFRRA